MKSKRNRSAACYAILTIGFLVATACSSTQEGNTVRAEPEHPEISQLAAYPAEIPSWLYYVPDETEFDFPLAESFDSMWRENSERATPWILAEATSERYGTLLIGVRQEQDDSLFIRTFVINGDISTPDLIDGDYEVVSGSWNGLGTVSLRYRANEDLEFEVTTVYHGLTPQRDHLALWTYSTTLINSSPPVYETNREEVVSRDEELVFHLEEEFRLAAVRQQTEHAHDILETMIELGSVLSAEAAEFAMGIQDDRLARAVLRRWIPRGMCSMDPYPQSIAERYAALCRRQGDLGCFLQLHVQLMGNQFPRRSNSSAGALLQPTYSSGIAESGVDVERFLSGLLIEYQGVPRRHRSIGPWRLGMAMAEAGLSPTSPQELVEDETLDPFNRLRATATLLSLLVNSGENHDRTQVPPEVCSRLLDLDLHSTSLQWVTGAQVACAP